MIELEGLTEEERNLVYGAPILVAVLIAGADGTIDKSEMRQAISMSGVKKMKARKELIDYYAEVSKDFEDKLKISIANYPSDPKERENEIIEGLKKLNPILEKLDNTFALMLYESLKDFAKKIAEASGGVLGYLSIGYEESKLIDLKMIKDPSAV